MKRRTRRKTRFIEKCMSKSIEDDHFTGIYIVQVIYRAPHKAPIFQSNRSKLEGYLITTRLFVYVRHLIVGKVQDVQKTRKRQQDKIRIMVGTLVLISCLATESEGIETGTIGEDWNK